MAVLEALGHQALISSVNSYFGVLLARMGDFEDAHRHFKRAEDFLRSVNAPLHLAEFLYNRSRAEQMADDLNSARATLSEALDIAERIQLGSDSELGRNLEAQRAKLNS